MARKYAQIHVRNGLLIQTCKYPLMFARKRKDLHPHSQVGDLHPILLPHKFGASFDQYGKPNLKYIGGLAIIKEQDHIVIFRNKKTTIWLKHYIGSNINELVTNGEKQIRAIAQAYEHRFSIRLEFDRIFQDIEWADTSKERSKKVAQAADIAPHTQKLVAGAYHKYQDSTHPESLEINAAPNHPKERPTEHAKVHEFIYSGKLTELLEQIGNSIVVINQKVEMINEKLKFK